MNPEIFRTFGTVRTTIDETSDEVLIIYHISSRYINKGTYEQRSKLVKECSPDCCEERYLQLRPYWGNIIIFGRDERTENCYAHLLDSNGVRRHELTRGMFERIKKISSVKHVYVDRLKGNEMIHALKKVDKMGPEQLDDLCKKIKQRRNELERNADD